MTTLRNFTKHISRKRSFALTSILIFIIYYETNSNNTKPHKIHKQVSTSLEVEKDKPEKILLQHILLWGDAEQAPLSQFGEGRSVFHDHNCSWTNCYVTSDRNHLSDYTQFEVIVFNGPQLNDIVSRGILPGRRAPHQLYVYLNLESAANYPVCTDRWNGYFNLTWTYRLDSDLVWRYYVIENASGHNIAPSPLVSWQENGSQLGSDLTELPHVVRRKRKAVAWFVSNCDTSGMREELGQQIRQHLRNYDLDIDIYGECGNLICPLSAMDVCLMKLEREYFFYLAFENAISEDYVTEKVLHALNHRTVPIVFGGANYSRFLPPGSYLDAVELGARRTAERIAQFMRQPNEYLQLFEWRKHYRIVTPGTQICDLCAAVNSKPSPRNTTMQFRRWWTPLTSCKDVIIANIH